MKGLDMCSRLLKVVISEKSTLHIGGLIRLTRDGTALGYGLRLIWP